MHTINLIIHVLAGLLALITGFFAIFTIKSDDKHIQYGRFFLKTMAIVTVTALIGIFAFNGNTFLLVITLLSGYNAYSGWGVMKMKNQKLTLLDYIIPLIVLSSGVYYIYYIRSIGLYWSPVIIYSTLSALSLVTLYDLSKFFIPAEVLRKTMIYEHIYKMSSSLSGITSAFVGTVLPQFQPYSQILPSIFGLLFIMITFIYQAKMAQKRKSLLL